MYLICKLSRAKMAEIQRSIEMIGYEIVIRNPFTRVFFILLLKIVKRFIYLQNQLSHLRN